MQSRRGIVAIVEERDGEHQVEVTIVARDLVKTIRYEIHLPFQLFDSRPFDELDRLGQSEGPHRCSYFVYCRAFVDRIAEGYDVAAQVCSAAVIGCLNFLGERVDLGGGEGKPQAKRDTWRYRALALQLSFCLPSNH